jgi:hypothetical protein
MDRNSIFILQPAVDEKSARFELKHHNVSVNSEFIAQRREPSFDVTQRHLREINRDVGPVPPFPSKSKYFLRVRASHQFLHSVAVAIFRPHAHSDVTCVNFACGWDVIENRLSYPPFFVASKYFEK